MRIGSKQGFVEEAAIKLLSQQEVAAIIGKSAAWLARKRWEGGGIPFKKLGRHVRYLERDVLRWVESHPTKLSTSDPGQ